MRLRPADSRPGLSLFEVIISLGIFCIASVMGSIKIAHRGGQNHRPAKEAIAARLHERFGQAL